MLISQALAQETPVAGDTTAETMAPGGADAALAAPSTQNILIQNVGMIVLLVVMFYFLLIRPQQKRFKEHKAMIDALKVGDSVITAGGLLGRIDTLVNDEEVIVDLGNGLRVTAVRATIQVKNPKIETVKK